MVDTIHLFAFALIFLMVMGIIGNSNPTSQALVAHVFEELRCPMPEGDGKAFSNTGPTRAWSDGNATEIDNRTYNIVSDSNSTKTLYGSDGELCTTISTPFGRNYAFGEPTLALGVFFFAVDYISEGFHKIIATFFLIFLYIAPVEVEFLGFAIDELTLFGQLVVFSVYTFSYIFIGLGVYKLLNPFGGA